MKRAYEKGKQSAPRMMVTAWGAQARMSLAAKPVVKGDETNAAIAMLSHLDIKGAIITGDALHCNRRMAQSVIDGLEAEATKKSSMIYDRLDARRVPIESAPRASVPPPA